jgi:hypothetical protein
MDTRQRAIVRVPQTKPAASPAVRLAASVGRGVALERKDAEPELKHLSADLEFKYQDDGTAIGTVSGYASVFGLLDRGGDIVAPGAFKKTLADWKKRKAAPPMLWQHDSCAPIGTWISLEEDEKGLKVTGQLVLDVQQAKDARALVMAGAVKAMSIGYISTDDTIDRATGVRTLKAVDLWEISLVTFPMLPEALINGAKSDFDPKALERLLRDEGGLSISDAKTAISVFRKHALRDAGSSEPGPRDGATEMLMTLRKAAEALR